MGKALRDGYRQRAFLMTKIDGRDKNTAARQIDEPLRRLQTDLVQDRQVTFVRSKGREFGCNPNKMER